MAIYFCIQTVNGGFLPLALNPVFITSKSLILLRSSDKASLWRSITNWWRSPRQARPRDDNSCLIWLSSSRARVCQIKFQGNSTVAEKKIWQMTCDTLWHVTLCAKLDTTIDPQSDTSLDTVSQVNWHLASKHTWHCAWHHTWHYVWHFTWHCAWHHTWHYVWCFTWHCAWHFTWHHTWHFTWHPA